MSIKNINTNYNLSFPIFEICTSEACIKSVFPQKKQSQLTIPHSFRIYAALQKAERKKWEKQQKESPVPATVNACFINNL